MKNAHFRVFWKIAPRDPQKGKKSILMGSLVVLDPNGSPKKILSIFGTGCHKVCLNGANPIYGCRVKMAPDINPIYAGLERSCSRDSKNISYGDVGLV